MWTLTLLLLFLYLGNAIGWFIKDELWQFGEWERKQWGYLVVAPLLFLLVPLVVGRLAEWITALIPLVSPLARKWAGWLWATQTCWFLGYAVVVQMGEHSFGEDLVVGMPHEIGWYLVLIPFSTFMLTWLVFFAIQEVGRRMAIFSAGGRRLAFFVGSLGAIAVLCWLALALGGKGLFTAYFMMWSPATGCLLGFLLLFYVAQGIGWVIEGYRLPTAESKDDSSRSPAPSSSQERTQS